MLKNDKAIIFDLVTTAGPAGLVFKHQDLIIPPGNNDDDNNNNNIIIIIIIIIIIM